MSSLKLYHGPALQALLGEINRPVHLHYHAWAEPETTVLEALQTVQDLSPLFQVHLQPYADTFLDRVTIQADSGPALHFLGAPLGTELAALVSAIVVVGRGQAGLETKTEAALQKLTQSVQLEVFTSPTCPNCSQMVSLAHKFAYATPLITATAISAVAALDLARQYGVQGTPHTVVNGQTHLRGRLLESKLLAAVLAEGG
jgi:alkyl hydroperoxide reductase subunit AhpF